MLGEGSTCDPIISENFECALCSVSFLRSEGQGHGKVTLGCSKGHYLCGDCSQTYAMQVLAISAAVAFPPTCKVCQDEIPGDRFEKLLNQDQLSLYLKQLATRALHPGETLAECTQCSYFEVWESGTTKPDFFWCQACGQGHCYHCKELLSPPQGSEREGEWGKEAELRHLACANQIDHIVQGTPIHAADERTPTSPGSVPQPEQNHERKRLGESQASIFQHVTGYPNFSSFVRCMSMPI
mmetsp:Transcript_3599/g.7031  ORF Transcript_3599/g.7031 Transcript_3599/m.7031 type:complete len:240 (+) Transcript_3599:134-853(+)